MSHKAKNMSTVIRCTMYKTGKGIKINFKGNNLQDS